MPPAAIVCLLLLAAGAAIAAATSSAKADKAPPALVSLLLARPRDPVYGARWLIVSIDPADFEAVKDQIAPPGGPAFDWSIIREAPDVRAFAVLVAKPGAVPAVAVIHAREGLAAEAARRLGNARPGLHVYTQATPFLRRLLTDTPIG